MKRTANFYMMVGLPGCGKSSWVGEMPAAIKIVSSDAIRKELYGSEEIQENPAKVFEVALKRIKLYLSNGEDCVLDATNINAKRRASFIKQLPKCNKTCVVLLAPVTTCLARDMQRKRSVGARVIAKMVTNFQLPEYWEGWNAIRFFHTTNERIDLDYVLEKYKDIGHDNPHHSATITGHMEYAEEFADIYGNEVLSMAARYHDVGKFATKTFDDDGVAHYFGHHNVGAYLWLNSEQADRTSQSYNVARLIYHHMDHYMMDHRALDKVYVRLGELGDVLKKLEMIDMASH